MYDLTVAYTHTYYVIAGNTPVLVHNCGLPNNRSLDIQKIELQAAQNRGVSATTLGEGAGMDGLRTALGSESDFKWAVTMEGDLRVMPAFAGGGPGNWPRIELAHTVLAGVDGKVRAAGSGTFVDGLPAFITNESGHFIPPASTLTTGESAFERAGIDFISSVFEP